MKTKITCLVLAVAFALTAFACGGDKDVITSAEIPAGYTEMSVRDANGRKTDGFGTQIDTHILKSYNAMTDEELEMFFSRVKEMNLQCIRTQVFPEWYEGGNDNSDPDSFDKNSPNVRFDSAEMKQLYRLLDFCEANDISVDLSFYGCQPGFVSEDGVVQGSWLAATQTKNWISSPKLVDENGNAFPGLEEFAETVYGLLDHIINTKKYTCVDEFSIYPEPDLSYVTAKNSVSATEYYQLVKIVDAKLKKEGIRNKIRFSGAAASSSGVMDFLKYRTNIGDIFDKYTISSYKYDAEDDNRTFNEYGEAMTEIADEVNAPFAIAEFGSKNVINPHNQTDTETYERALFLARYMICMVNNGLVGMKYWEICDMFYGDTMMNLGLWKFRDNNWVARPQYYTWSLITKYTDKGSDIYPIKSDDGELCAVAFRLPDGNWSYMVCNNGKDYKNLSFVNYNEGYPKSMKLYEVRASLVAGLDVKPIASTDTIDVAGGAINVRVAPASFVVLSTK